MPQAKITINGTPGSNTDLTIGAIVTLGNLGIGGELTYNWAILDQPPGVVDSLSSATSPFPTFTPRKEGTYLIQLIVNQSLPTQVSDQVVAGILQVRTRIRQPAAGETTEASTSDGWALATNDSFRRLDDALASPGVITAYVNSGPPAVGSVVKLSSTATIMSGLPGQQDIVAVDQAFGGDVAILTAQLGIVIGAIDGGSIGIGRLIYVRTFGSLMGVSLSGATIGAAVYVGNTGSISLTPGTNSRVLGYVLSVPSPTTANIELTSSAAASRYLRPVTYVVGNASNGDTLDTVDFVDPGDGTGIAAAKAALGSNVGTIVVRRGLYIFAGNAATIDLVAGQCVVGEGRGATQIGARQGDVATVPWRVFRLTGADAAVSDLSIIIAAQAPVVPSATDAIGVISVESAACRVQRVSAGILGTITAQSKPLSLVHFPGPTAPGACLIEDVRFDVVPGSITGNALNQLAVALVTSGTPGGTDNVTAELVGVPETRFVRCSIYGKCDEAAVPPYDTVGMYMLTMSEYTALDCRFEGVSDGIQGTYASSGAGSTTLQGPVLERCEVHLSDGLISTSGGISISYLTPVGTTLLRRVHALHCRIRGGLGASVATAINLSIQATASRDLRIEQCYVVARTAAISAFVSVSDTTDSRGALVANNMIEAAGGGGATSHIFISGFALRPKVVQNSVDDITINTTYVTDAMVHNNHVTTVTDSGVGTSILGNVI